MRELEKPVARVFRRLRVQRFLAALVWSWAIGLAIVAGVIGGEKLLNRFLPAPDWVPFAVAGGVGLLVAGLIAVVSGPSRMDAAVAIDRVFHLNERLSSALTLPEDLRETSGGPGPDRRRDPEGDRPGRRRRVRPADAPPGLGRPDPGELRGHAPAVRPRPGAARSSGPRTAETS